MGFIQCPQKIMMYIWTSTETGQTIGPTGPPIYVCNNDPANLGSIYRLMGCLLTGSIMFILALKKGKCVRHLFGATSSGRRLIAVSGCEKHDTFSDPNWFVH